MSGGDHNPFESGTAAQAAELVSRSREQREAPDATRGARFAGFLIDLFLVIAAIIPGFVWVWTRMGGDKLDELVRRASEWTTTSPEMLVMLAPTLIVHAIQSFLMLTRGQTVAKVWLKTKIVRMDGGDIGLIEVLLRYWLPFGLGYIENVGNLFNLVDCLMIFGEQRRTLHDHIARTRVIDVRDHPELVTKPPLVG